MQRAFLQKENGIYIIVHIAEKAKIYKSRTGGRFLNCLKQKEKIMTDKEKVIVTLYTCSRADEPSGGLYA